MWAPPRWPAWSPGGFTSACSPTSGCRRRRPPRSILAAWWISAMESHRCVCTVIPPPGGRSGVASSQEAIASGISARPCIGRTGPSPAAIRCCRPAPGGTWASCWALWGRQPWRAVWPPPPPSPICSASPVAAPVWPANDCAASSISSCGSIPRNPPTVPPPSMEPRCCRWPRSPWGSGIWRVRCRPSARPWSRPSPAGAAGCCCGTGWSGCIRRRGRALPGTWRAWGLAVPPS